MTEAARPDLSVVIPTHNRCERLFETLRGLSRQTLAPARFEVIVVIDAGTDDTAARLDSAEWPFACRHVAAEGRGAAAARNTGASLARADRLLFLDDDITLDPGALAAHIAPLSERLVIVGHSEPVIDERTYLGKAVADWWREQFRKLARSDHRFGYSDVMSGNLSVGRADFLAVGGFDTALACREDYELGYRLISAGLPVTYRSAARGDHFDASTPRRNLARAYAEGIGDLQMARRHGELFPWLRAANMTASTGGARALRFLCLTAPSIGAFVERSAALLPIVERLGLRQGWSRLNNLTRALAYQRGVAAEAHDYRELQMLAASASVAPPAPFRGDLLDGPDAVLEAAAQGRHEAMTLYLGQRYLGHLYRAPGFEPLRPAHVRALLSETAPLWAAAREALADLPTLPPKDPGWVQAAADGASGVALAEIDCATWSITPLTEPAFPMRALLRRGKRPLGWIHFARRPDPNSFWPTVRDEIIGNYGTGMRLIRDTAFPAPAPPLPPISVVVCTRDRTDLLRRCLGALKALDYPDYEIIVVDNAPATTGTRDLVAADPALRYVREDRPGLDWARNCGIAAARHAIIAYTDDDTAPDRHWLTGIAEAFADPATGFVTGLVAPMKLDTDARLYFEDIYGGMGKGFDAVTRDPAEMSHHDLLWASGLGVGANMAFRRAVFEKAGAFDPALDVGTVTRGGGDIEMFHRALAHGFVHVYQPAALVWHEHRPDFEGLQRQLADNGSGFASYLLACHRNRTVPPGAIARFALRAWIWDWQIGRLARPGRHARPFVLAEIRGMLAGPGRWRRSQSRAAELATAAPRG